MRGAGDDAAALLRSTWARLIAALVIYSLAACILFWPVVGHLRTAVLWEPGDLTSTARDYWAAAEQGKTPFTLTKDRLMFAPQGQTRAPSLQIANPVQPLFVLAIKPWLGLLGGLNLYMLAGFVLSATAMFALLGRLGLGTLPSAFGGFVFGFNWWQYEQAFFGHIGLNHLWVFPVLVLALLGLRRRRTNAAALIAGGVLSLSFYVFSYLGLFAAALAVLFAIVDIFTVERARLRTLRLHIESWVTAGILLLPPLIASRLMSAGFSRSFVFTKAYFHGASLSDYFIPPAHSAVFGRFFGAGRWPAPHIGESTQFFGWTTLALAAGGALLWLLRRQRTLPDQLFATYLALWLIPLGFVCSLPAYGNVAGHRIALPSAAFVVGSVTNWWKIYSRFGILVGLALVILAAFFLSRLVAWRPLIGSFLAVVFLALVVVEMIPGTPAPTWDAAKRPAESRWLERHPGGIVAEYPMLQYWNSNALNSPEWPLYVWSSVYDQVRHRHPLYANPSLAMDGSRTEAIRLLSLYPGRPLTPRVLTAENVRYVVVHDDVYRALGLRVPRLDGSYRQVARLGSTRILKPTAPPADIPKILQLRADDVESARGIGPAQIKLVSGFQGMERYYGIPSRWLDQDGIVQVTTVNTIIPTRYVFEMRGFSNRVPRRLVLRIRDGRTLGSTEVAPVDQPYRIGPFTLPPGKVDLVLHADPGPELLGAADRRYASIYIEQHTILPLAY